MRSLALGSTGPAVSFLQLALRRYGSDISVDGIFGEETAGFVRAFQSRSGLYPDGIAGPATHNALYPYYTGFLRYTVRPGDSIYSVSRRYGVSEQSVLTANSFPGTVYPGQVIIVPLSFSVVPTDIPYFSSLVYYCVRGLRARYPFLRTGSVGASVMGRPLHSLVFGRGENRVIYNACHHANEWICTPLLLRFCEELCSAYVSGADINDISPAEIFDYAAVSIIPCVDPDGMDLVTGELQTGPFFDRAVSISSAYPQIPRFSGWKANINGVDLNLQYPADWEEARRIKFGLGFTSPAPSDYVGFSPLSQPESRAMYNYTRSVSPALTLSFHTQGNVIYWRYQDSAPIGSEQIAGLFSELSGYTLDDVPYASSFAGYRDWFIQDYIRPGFTVEAGLGTNPLPLSQFDSIYASCLPILVYGTLVT